MKKRYCFKIDIMDTNIVDLECYETFWKPRINILKQLLHESKPPHITIEEFIEDIDDLDSKYDLRVASDCPISDFGFINAKISKHTTRRPIQFDSKGNFRCLLDIDSISRGLDVMSFSKAWVSNDDLMKKYKFEIESKMTHYPDEDAEHIALFILHFYDVVNNE
jgi:hypothetical protein